MGLSYQQNSVFERLTENNAIVRDMNAAIRGRANFLTAASTAIVGLIAAAKFLPSGHENLGVEYVLLALVCLCSVGMYWRAALIWRSENTELPGTCNLDKLYSAYIGQEIDVAFHNLLSDLCEAVDKNLLVNQKKASHLDAMVRIFMIQLTLLAISVAWGPLTHLFGN